MKKKKAGTEFEELAKEIFDLITKGDKNCSIEGPKVFLKGKDGKREFDLILRSTAAGLNFLTVVECRDHNKRLDVTHIDGFHSKMQDVLANKGVLISRKGFTKNAAKKAKRLGISLYVGHDGKQVSDDLTKLGFGVSVVVYHIQEIEIGDLKFAANFEAGQSYSTSSPTFNDKNINEHIQNAFFNGLLRPKITENFQIWDPMKYFDEIYVRDESGKKVPVSDISFPVKIRKMSTYWGYFHQLPNTKGLVSLPEGKHEFVFKSDDLIEGEYKKVFQKFDRFGDVPLSNLTAIRGEFTIKFNDKVTITGPL